MAFIDMIQIIIKMFKNPLKYQSGGSTPTQQQQDQLVQLFQAAAKNAQVDPEALVKKAQELGQDENAAAQFMEGLQRCAQGDPAGIQFIKSLFTSSHKRGGKIQDFICKHGRGGVAGCGCEKPVEKHQQENGKGRGIIGALSGLYNRFIGQRMPDVPGVNNRRVRTWTDANGIQHIVEDANVNGNSTITTIDINGADTLGTQKITTGDGRYRMVNLQPGTPQWRSVMSRNVPQQESGGKVEKAQNGEKTNDAPYNGTISQGKPRSKVSQVIDNNSKARNFVKGAKQFVKSPMVKWPLAGALAYGGYHLGLTPTVQSMGEELAPHMAPYLFPFLSQMRPKFILDTMNPMKEPPKVEKPSDVFWAVPSNEKGGKIKK